MSRNSSRFRQTTIDSYGNRHGQHGRCHLASSADRPAAAGRAVAGGLPARHPLGQVHDHRRHPGDGPCRAALRPDGTLGAARLPALRPHAERAAHHLLGAAGRRAAGEQGHPGVHARQVDPLPLLRQRLPRLAKHVRPSGPPLVRAHRPDRRRGVLPGSVVGAVGALVGPPRGLVGLHCGGVRMRLLRHRAAAAAVDHTRAPQLPVRARPVGACTRGRG